MQPADMTHKTGPSPSDQVVELNDVLRRDAGRVTFTAVLRSCVRRLLSYSPVA